MEIQLRLQGNSEAFVLQAKKPDENNWQDRFWIEQEDEYYRLSSEQDDILILKEPRELSKTKRIVVQTNNQQISYHEEKFSEHLLEAAWWHETFHFYQNDYTLRYIGSGTKGEIVPVNKNNQPVAVFATSNLEIAGKRNVSLYVNDLNEVDACLILYVISYITSIGFLKIDSLNVRYRFFYQFSGRKALTDEHLAMLPESRRPKLLEAIVCYFLGGLLVVVISLIDLKPLVSFLTILTLFHAYNLFRNLREKNE